MDFSKELIHFNILKIFWNEDSPEYHLISTPLFPYQWEDLEQSLKKAGFLVEAKFGNMNFTPFDEKKSDNLVMVCKLQ